MPSDYISFDRTEKQAPNSNMSAAAKKTAQKPASHPSYKEMVVMAIKADGSRNGCSRQGLKKFIAAKYPEVAQSPQMKVNLKRALKTLKDAGVITSPLNHGASFKLVKKEATKVKKVATTAKSAQKKKTAAAKKPKTASAKKAVAKKPRAKKAGAKKATAAKKTPKKPAAKKVAKKTPKKSATKKKTVKKTATKKK